MAGPYPPHAPGGAEGQPAPGPAPYPAEPYPYPGVYPGPLPPPVGYPAPSRRGRPLLWVALGLGLVAALVVAVLAFSGGRTGPGRTAFTDAAAKTTIQNYLDALSDGDTETVARNTLCGMFDAIKDRKSDLALARLASDAFRKQFTQAQVTSIDKIVLNSPYQAQVLFTMKVASTSTSRKTREQEQGVAHLLRQGNQLLVCSYLLRTTAQY
ncbi:hypothetical protein [Mycolicibacterium sp.]|uniref:Rv0361 family membrane protein n=1 Tax=Mycolicibacterium sp. TaxID=2320850 RepID=UPI001D9B367C|nr:hypothetical protein [Mycolicibacterium sp.]MCB1290246.1 hypothetical protein [Mycobacterium sp.]MCB9410748.1 hypothetical protein [Mycolicibacterium sp.]